MRFEEALQALREGKFVARADWYGLYLIMQPGDRILEFEANSIHGNISRTWRVESSDLLAEDWKLVEIGGAT